MDLDTSHSRKREPPVQTPSMKVCLALHERASEVGIERAVIVPWEYGKGLDS